MAEIEEEWIWNPKVQIQFVDKLQCDNSDIILQKIMGLLNLHSF